MKIGSSLSVASMLAIASSVANATAADLPHFYGDAPDEHHPWAVHDGNRPQPPIVVPGTFSTQEQPGKPPSDAVILFDGTDLSKWEADNGPAGTPTKWVIKNGAMECVPGSGYIRTRDKFGDIQLHVEWASPTKVEGESQGRGNSGVFLLGLVEIQVLDNYHNPTYADGMAAAVYGQHAPLANALRPPGEFQSYDIAFRRPIYRDGREVDPGYVTVFENGVLVEDHALIEGETGHMRRAKPMHFPDAGPLKLQDHGNPVRYRNIWYRPLPPRESEGGTDGALTVEDTKAKRAELAASIRDDAQKLANPANPLPEMFRLAESLVYAQDDATSQKVQQMAAAYVDTLEGMPPDQRAQKKDEARHVREVFNYLVRFKVFPDTFAPRQKLQQIIKSQNWDKK
ncbi:MAG TPA: DUF1080 domain-containing protein [Verrucomicrobiae bacterium]|nr:DUF1080 domain-containing protein [Verrucomicrobiae bacterium]